MESSNGLEWYEAQRIAAQAGVDGLQGIDSLKVCRVAQAHISENSKTKLHVIEASQGVHFLKRVPVRLGTPSTSQCLVGHPLQLELQFFEPHKSKLQV